MQPHSRRLVKETPGSNPRSMSRYQQHRWAKILAYVWKHSTFYRDYYESQGIRENDLAQVTVRDLPFVSKQTLMNHFDEVATDPRLSKKELEQWAQDNQDPHQSFHKDFIVINSSGSSGKVALFVYDRKAWQIANSTLATRLPVPDENLGRRTRVAYYMIAHRSFGGITTGVKLPKDVYDILFLSLFDEPERVIEQLNSFQPDRITGYPGSVTMLAEWAIQGKLRICPQRIFVGSQKLTKSAERKLYRAWGSPVHEFYSASESIYIAIREPGETDMSVMDDLNIVEILDDHNQPVSDGEQGRVVITNLYNYTFPVLRYEIGDCAVRGKTREDSPFSKIREIQGRLSDDLPVMMDDGGYDTIHWGTLSSIYATNLETVQFISPRPDHVEIHYVADHDIDHKVRKEFRRILEIKGATKTTFEVHRVPNILVDSNTGKVRAVRIEQTQLIRSPRTDLDAGPQFSERSPVWPKNPFIEFKKEEIEQSIGDRFEKIVRKYPNRLAVKWGNHALSYDELNKAANRMARGILKGHRERQQPIALLFEHGGQAIAGMLGVLKTGKIYVPLDPRLPKARITYMLEDVGADLIVTNNTNLALAKNLARHELDVLNVDDQASNLSDENTGLPVPPITPAWILYTSGSTGEPKGVVQNHRNVLHSTMRYTNGSHISAEDRLSFFFSYSFSASVTNMFGALLNGAGLFPFDVSKEGFRRLVAWLIQERITVYHSVPTVFRNLVATLSGEETFPALRLIELAGEHVTTKDVELYKKHFSDDCIFHNRLGLTEIGTLRQYFLDKNTSVTGSTIPVGYEVANCEVLLLDDSGNPVDTNCLGEIAVKSGFLALGYWQKSDLTKAKFLPDPKGGDERIYLTGDLGRMLPHQCLVYLGRKDLQAKVRGSIVDVTEVEGALCEHPAIKEAVVVVREDQPGDTRLIAYFVVPEQSLPSVSELRTFLREKLPDYMIPSSFVALDDIPLTPVGKVDREALPLPSKSRPELDTPFLAPRTPVEAQLAESWAEVLSLDQVGVNDNFFDLGGHSLAVIRIINRIIKAYQLELPIETFFDSPTVAGIATVINKHQGKKLSGNELEQIFTELDSLSEEEAKKHLSESSSTEKEIT